MKRSLLTQIRNDWRENIWIVVELAVVLLAIWAIVTFLYAMNRALFSERGFTPEDVYVFQVRQIPEDSPEYVVPDSTAGKYDDRNALLRRLRELPEVEAVALSSNAIPYNYNYNGNSISRTDRVDSVDYQANFRWGSPDIVKVLKFKSLNGMSEDQMVKALENNEILISPNPGYEHQGMDYREFLGKTVYLGNDSSKIVKVAGLVAGVRRNDYEESWGGTVVVAIDENKRWASEIAVRVKPGHAESFKQKFLSNKSLQRQRNFYLTDLHSLTDQRDVAQRRMMTTNNLLSVIILFLLMTIFLGLLGTFWFRMQQRVGEIAIRKVCGATRGDIFRRVITEGLILLAVATIFVSSLGWPLFGKVKMILPVEWQPMLVVECIAIVFVALTIILSVLYPARKAMSIEPAIAIKDE